MTPKTLLADRRHCSLCGAARLDAAGGRAIADALAQQGLIWPRHAQRRARRGALRVKRERRSLSTRADRLPVPFYCMLDANRRPLRLSKLLIPTRVKADSFRGFQS